MKKILFLLPLLFLALGFSACSDDDDKGKTANDAWATRNAEYFKKVLTSARTAIRQAQATYGNAWESHCPYRIYPSYLLTTGIPATAEDSIIVEISKRGTGTAVTPLFSDSVHINYIGRTIPTADAPQGKMFDHSSIRTDSASIFSPTLSLPTKFAVSGVIPGMTTALLHMPNIGEQWRVYVSQKLAYQNVEKTGIPASSTLIFDMQLKGVYRNGTRVPNWGE